MKILLVLAVASALFGQRLPPATQAGEKLVRRYCSACHGAQLQGTEKAPALATPGIRGTSPEALRKILRDGRLTKGMPSFASLPEARRRQIVDWLTRPHDSVTCSSISLFTP